MKINFTLQVRRFPVRIHDRNTGAERTDTIVLTKEHLQAAQLVGQSSKELIERVYDRAGCTVLEIGKAERREISLNLEEMYQAHEARPGKREIAHTIKEVQQ